MTFSIVLYVLLIALFLAVALGGDDYDDGSYA